MTLSAGNRANLYDAFTAIGADKTAVNEMLAHFPTDDDDRPVTRQHFAAEMATIRAEMAKGFATVETEMAKLSRRTLVEVRLWIGLAVVVLGLVRFLT